MCMVRFPLLSVEFGAIVLGEKSNDKLVLFGVFSMCFKTCTVISLLLLCGSVEAFGTCLSGKLALRFPRLFLHALLLMDDFSS